ncbi:PDZ domain-containing protein [Metasolibacillus meyeri]|uniref:PDZ domain-containing protein n=1 Tax=Metasolibacillus meyeri TaxID=1071052 RepID=A0AAW9NW72_9BACL|nr:PDZ domain-containing protein [Metasolibacillus meyeri]MEC1178840.1 PDZ domain-containing protein [Metasolibacillus meyeri]
MYIDIIIEVLMAILRFIMNPLLYVAALFAIYLGYRRVKRERRFFRIRILNGWSELISFVKINWIASLFISMIIVAVGLVIPSEFLLLLIVVSIASMIIFIFHLLSPIVTIAISFSVLVAMAYFGKSFTVFGFTFEGFSYEHGAAMTITLIAGMLLMLEARFIRLAGPKFASPVVEQTKRGRNAVAYFSKGIRFVPLFFIVPGDAIASYLPWWPQFTLGASEFSLVLFPFVFGFQQMTKRTLPVYFYPKYSRAIFILAQLVIIGGLASNFIPLIGVITLMSAAILRLLISLYYKIQERTDAYAVAPLSRGVIIAGVLPNSPAEKMGLVAGEVIRKVNGKDVFTESELYEALQVNAAHCRLEILNHQNEVRLAQHVVHSNDHYKIGLLLVN